MQDVARMSASHSQLTRKRSHSSLGSVMSPLARVRTASAGGVSLSRSAQAQDAPSSSSLASESYTELTDNSQAMRFSASSSDFHLPARPSTPSSPQLVNQATTASSPIVSVSSTNGIRTALAADSEYSTVSLSSLPLLRRAAKAAAYANANRYRMRRGSMLGREVAREDASTSSDDGDEEMDSGGEERKRRPRRAIPVSEKSPSPNEALRRAHNGLGMSVDMEDDDDMQIETGDVSLEGVQLDSRSRPNTPPPSVRHGRSRSKSNADLSNLYGLSSSPNANFDQAAPNIFLYPRGAQGRRGMARRGGAAATLRDRSVLRVAASLRDESRPSDSEIASEAKLQRRICPESDSITPTTPRLAAVGTRSPTVTSKTSTGTFVEHHQHDDDVMFGADVHGADPYDGESSSDEEERSTSKVNTITATFGHTPSMAMATASAEATDEGSASHPAGIAIPGAAEQHERLWLGFRETTPVSAARSSPGADRRVGAMKVRASASSVNGGGVQNVDMQMEGEPRPASAMLTGASSGGTGVHRSSVGAPSPGLWGKSTTKRKHESDRYEPYSASLHKRRAASPVAGTSSAAVFHRAQSSTPGAPGQSPLLNAVMAQQSPLLSMNLTGLSGMTTSNLPTPTPLSIPSPTLSAASLRSYINAGNSLSKSAPNNGGIGINGKWAGGTATESPSSTRPSTPTNMMLPSFHGPGPSPSLLSSSVGKALAAGNGAGGGSSSVSGSGPGYGSGALGLSLGSASKRFKQEQEEQEEQEGMLDDVNAIKLGEM